MMAREITFWSSVTLGNSKTRGMAQGQLRQFWSSVTLGNSKTQARYECADCKFWSSVTLGNSKNRGFLVFKTNSFGVVHSSQQG